MSYWDTDEYKSMAWWEKAVASIVLLIAGHGVHVNHRPSGPRPRPAPAPPRNR